MLLSHELLHCMIMNEIIFYQQSIQMIYGNQIFSSDIFIFMNLITLSGGKIIFTGRLLNEER